MVGGWVKRDQPRNLYADMHNTYTDLGGVRGRLERVNKRKEKKGGVCNTFNNKAKNKRSNNKKSPMV